ncbi:MAG: transporter ATP-binding protein [Enterovirga sp.]|jgi:capsular polysaccharide transport system ATP-binding protein|nr:transporter ATP-binding protein [Enterovirga sp.]
MITLSGVHKHYRVAGHRRTVLRNVTGHFETGTSYGILGINGAGKSTLMRLLAGTEQPNAGRIRRSRRVSWPLGFSGGFHPLMSGRENLKFLARAYGQDVQDVIDFVEDFAELGDFIDAPIRTYSSGMGARLAFGLSMAIEFECYLIDELTAVGDARFAAKCHEVFSKRLGKSDIIMISHSMDTLKEYCTKGAVVADGNLMFFDDINDAVELYRRMNF